LSLVALIVSAVTQASASTPVPSLAGARAQNQAAQSPSLRPVTPTQSGGSPANPDHLFTVNDEKGVVLTCIAPQLEINPDTDLFKSCALAPGRTLDDLMHTFVQGIHYEQSEHQKERELWERDLSEKNSQKASQKQ
jgi:hypothetical protein